MYFIIRKEGERPLDVAREIALLDDTLVEVDGRRKTKLELHPDRKYDGTAVI